MLDGVSIAGYRSFGDVAVRIGDLDRVNVFIGSNNCGKSNILRAVKLVADVSGGRRSDSEQRLDPLLDYPLTASNKEMLFGVQIRRDGATNATYQKIADGFGRSWQQLPEFADSYWASFVVPAQGSRLQPSTASVDELAALIALRVSQQALIQVFSSMLQRSGGNHDGRSKEISAAMHAAATPKFTAYLVGAFRRITDTGDNSLAGAGLIGELRKLQSPDLASYRSAKLRFERINGFLRDVLGEPNAKLEIPAEPDQILVTLDGKVLPLESLGTGIHELIILASAVTLVDDAIFCLEEPEIHLHPGLQKKFMRYIATQTSNQYMIATHSNAFFDLDGVNLYSCRLASGTTACKEASAAGDKHAVLQELGYRPSDLLQSNFVVWVEGPSDRIYLKHWIAARAPELVEGLHYAIMFYGGRLLAHLCYDDPMLDDFIRLSCLNRNACIVMDSDRATAHGHLGKTKSRVRREFEGNGCIAWITSGRTIENYVQAETLVRAAQLVHPRAYTKRKWDRFADLTRVKAGRSFDKVAVARQVAAQQADLDTLDLAKTVDALVAAIRACNGSENRTKGST